MADPLSIAFLCHASCGGSTKVALELAAQLSELGHQIYVLSLTPISMETSPSVRRYSAFSSRAAQRPSSELYLKWSATEKEALVLKLLELYRRHSIQLVHFHYAVPFAEIVHEMQTRLGAHAPKAIGTLHGTDVSAQRHADCAAQRPGLSSALNRMELITTVSKAYSSLARRLFDLRTAPVVIPNFINTERFKPIQKSQQSMAARKIRLVHVSNFRPVKNSLAVARLFAAIHTRMNAELWLVGDGQELRTIKAYLRDSGLMAHVRCFGFRNDVHRILPEADILLMPSNEESFCLAALEAMACGLPVVATRVGGLTELVEHALSGYLFEPGNLRQGMHYVEQLSTQPNMYFRARSFARQRARAFEACRVVAQYEFRYRSLLVEKNPRHVRSWFSALVAESASALEQ